MPLAGQKDRPQFPARADACCARQSPLQYASAEKRASVVLCRTPCPSPSRLREAPKICTGSKPNSLPTRSESSRHCRWAENLTFLPQIEIYRPSPLICGETEILFRNPL